MHFVAHRRTSLLYSRCHQPSRDSSAHDRFQSSASLMMSVPPREPNRVAYHESLLLVHVLKVQRGCCAGPHENGLDYESERVHIQRRVPHWRYVKLVKWEPVTHDRSLHA